MTVADASLKINLRLNKGDSQDYDNLWNYHKADVFNKAILDWVRRQIRGKNQTQEGDEETLARVDDLQMLLKSDNLSLRDKGLFSESNKLPPDYLYFKRITPKVTKGECKAIDIISILKEEANIDYLINTIPSFEFEETFHTIKGNKINIYHNKKFQIEATQIVYYRKPKVYNFSKFDEVIEFKEDVAEIIVDEACKILSSDIESLNQKNLAQERAESNN